MKKDITSREYFRTLNLIYAAQLSAIAVFAGVAYYLINHGNLGPANNDLAVTFQKVIIIVVPLSLGAGYIMFRMVIHRMDPNAHLKDKMKKYFTANIIRSAFLEVPGLLVSVAAIITAHVLFLVIVPMILVVFLLFRPTRSVASQELKLSLEERAMLENPDAIISEAIVA